MNNISCRHTPFLNQSIQAVRRPFNSMSIKPSILRTFQMLITAAFCVVLLAASSTAFAQDPPRRLTGTVTDPQHEPLAGAVVQLHDDSTDSVVSYITGRTGRFSFRRVSPQDDFHVWAKFRGHTSPSKSISKFDSKPNRTIPLVIKLE
jgi:hypothetical protein